MSISIDVPRAYFEMARAIFNVLNVEMKKWEKDSHLLNDERKYNIRLSLGSTIIIQCYMTIEAFFNEELKNLWENSRKFENYMSQNKSGGIEEVQNAKPRFHDFHSKYGKYDDFEELKNKKNIKNLGKRIILICKTREFPLLHESDSETWEFFKKMEIHYRHRFCEGRAFRRQPWSRGTHHCPPLCIQYP